MSGDVPILEPSCDGATAISGHARQSASKLVVEQRSGYELVHISGQIGIAATDRVSRYDRKSGCDRLGGGVTAIGRELVVADPWPDGELRPCMIEAAEIYLD